MPKGKKIVVGVGDLLGCGYYRCALPYKYLSRLGYDVYLTNKLDMVLEPDDLLVLQRQHGEGVLRLTQDFKNRGGKLVFELDDYFHELPPNNPARHSYPKGGFQLRNLEKFMGMSDLLTVSTPALGDKYAQWAKNVKICYNAIDPNDFGHIEKKIPRNDGIVRLGWAGSGTHLDDLVPIVKPIVEIMNEYKNTHFVFVGMDYSKLFPRELSKRISHAGHTFPLHNGKALFYDSTGGNPVIKYYELLAKADIDIAIAPLINMSFNRSKSYIKLMEYGMVNIPFVATNFGPYNQFIRESKTNVGLLAESNSQWKRELKKFIGDESYRLSVANNNYDNVISNHAIEKKIDQWSTALASIDVFPSSESGSYTENIVKIS